VHPAAAERFKAADNDGYNRAKSHLDRTHTARVEQMKQTHAADIERVTHESAASAAVQQFTQRLSAANFEEMDPATVRELGALVRSEGWIDYLQGAEHRSALTGLASALTADDRWFAGLSDENRDELGAIAGEMSLALGSDLTKAKSKKAELGVYAEAFAGYLVERDKLRDKAIVATALASEKARLEKAAVEKAAIEGRANERDARGGPPAKPTGGAGGGGGFKTKLEARVAHSEGRITNDEMRRVRAGNLPES
jgi:electron transfer flavoprotein alpha subunit